MNIRKIRKDKESHKQTIKSIIILKNIYSFFYVHNLFLYEKNINIFNSFTLFFIKILQQMYKLDSKNINYAGALNTLYIISKHNNK